MKRFSVGEDGKGAYIVAAAKGDVAAKMSVLDMNATFGFDALKAGKPLTQQQIEMLVKATTFATGHVSRNATAGKMDDLDAALKAVIERHKSLASGKWSAGREGGEGESRNSLLSQGLAIVMGCEPADAAEYINTRIQAAWEAAEIEVGEDGTLDAESMPKEELSKARKVAAKVRKDIGDDPAVALEVAKIRKAKSDAELAEKSKAAEGKTSAFTKTA